jgi:hypothetical protein
MQSNHHKVQFKERIEKILMNIEKTGAHSLPKAGGATCPTRHDESRTGSLFQAPGIKPRSKPRR